MSAAVVIGVAGATVAITSSLLLAFGAVPTVHHVRAAADNAAVAAAEVALWWGESSPCDSAVEVAQSNGANLESCTCESNRCTVRTVSSHLGIPIAVTSSAGTD